MAVAILKYKPEQGRYVRGTAFGLFVVLAWYGAATFLDFLSWGWARRDLGFTIPVLDATVTPGLLAAVAVFVAAFIGLRYAVNHPKLADLLIDTEGELKRVTWPSWPDTWQGSIVVIVTVLAMLVVLAGVDLVLSRVFEHVVFGG